MALAVDRASTPADYLSVSVSSGASTDITALNGLNPAVPFVGGVVGFANTSDNLGVGSFNYAYLGGTAQTRPGRLPRPAPASSRSTRASPSTSSPPSGPCRATVR